MAVWGRPVKWYGGVWGIRGVRGEGWFRIGRYVVWSSLGLRMRVS